MNRKILFWFYAGVVSLFVITLFLIQINIGISEILIVFFCALKTLLFMINIV